MRGCLANISIPTPNKVRINDPKMVNYVFIEYAQNSSAYRFIVHKYKISDKYENTIIESRNAYFLQIYFLIKMYKK